MSERRDSRVRGQYLWEKSTDLRAKSLTEPDSSYIANAVDWLDILVGCLVSSIMALVQKFILARLRELNMRAVKRRLHTTFGVIFVAYSLIVLLTLILLMGREIGQYGFVSVTSMMTCLALYFGASLAIALPLFALHRVTRRWDAGHWVFRMANDILRAGQSKSNKALETVRHGPTYIQIFCRTFPVLPPK